MGEIHLGGTARSPEDVVSLHELKLQFAEIPITEPNKFCLLINRYQALREKLGLYYLCHGPLEGDPNDIETLENTYVKKVLQIISIMPKLDMSLLTLHLWLDPRFVTEEVIAYKIDLLKRLVERARDSRITICLENMSETAFHLRPLFKITSLLNLTLDLGHAQLLSTHNTACEIMDSYPERIKHIHLHDNRGGGSPYDDLHLPVGDGIIDFEEIFKKLREIDYSRTITLELKPQEIKKCLGHVKELLFST
jgi:sugar phosphate isomerase/epimerase